MILVDTDVIIDVLRNYAPAVSWLATIGAEAVGIPGLVAMELLQGCRNRAEQRQVETMLRPYILYWPTLADCTRAFDNFALYHLSHSLGILDALIAETTVGLNVELATFNTKHYTAVPALNTVQPYDRDTG
ncbi:MAG: PIN domain-containing protein [Anaerolineae bacterium]|jgi:predicted nucleic acid-binding protein